jgi:hypothetical protein
MPLTQHLYTQDEVSAALIFCILRGKAVEASFWATELLDSGLVEDIMLALKQVWLNAFGIKALGWFREYKRVFEGDEIDASEVIRLISGLCRLGANGKKDRSILTLLCSEIRPDRVNICDIPEGFGNMESFNSAEVFTLRAILQRKTVTAWGALRSLENPDEFLERAAMYKHGIDGCKLISILEGEVLEQRATVLTALCLPKDEFAASWNQTVGPILEEVSAELATWENLAGRRARRIYSIPSECLGLTERGKLSVYETNENDIIGSLEKQSALWGSPYWDCLAESYGGWEAIRENSRIRENFYRKHFRDDIPDEWSKEDRAKSHGHGGGTTKEKAFQALYSRLTSAVIWGSFKYVEWDLDPLDISSWILKPVKRVLRPETIEG